MRISTPQDVEHALAVAEQHFETSIRAFQSRMLADEADDWSIDDLDETVARMRAEFAIWKRQFRRDLEAFCADTRPRAS